MSHVRTIILNNIKDITREFPALETQGNALEAKVNEAEEYLENAPEPDEDVHDALHAAETQTTNIVNNFSSFTETQIGEILEQHTEDIEKVLP